MKVKTWFKNFLAGMGIGIGAAIPGVSGSAIAVIFKVYESIIWSVNNFFKKFGRAFAILLPILLGIIFAVIPCIWLFDKALENFVFGLVCIFAGFLIGSFPSVTEEVKGIKVTKKHIALIIIGAGAVLLLGVLSIIFGNKLNLNSNFNDMSWWFMLILIPIGMIAAVALTVPGLSGSLILLIVGFYKPLLLFTVEWTKEALVSNDWSNAWKLFGMLGCFAIGVLIGVIITSKIMKKFLDKHHDETYFVIIGFIAASILVLFFNYETFNYYCVWAGQAIAGYQPALPLYIEIPLGITLLVVGAIASYQLVRLSQRHRKERNHELGI
ncbi:MAG: DUF368 domain-containing protein [Bacilli bacterium]